MHRKGVTHLKRAAPTLANLIERVGPCRLTARAEGTHVDAVVRATVFQQLSGSSASTIHSRLLARYGGTTTEPRLLLDTPDAELRALGLSRQKVGYLKDLSRREAAGEAPVHMLHEPDDNAVIAALTAVQGVGLWTAQMFLMFRLGRPDSFPISTSAFARRSSARTARAGSRRQRACTGSARPGRHSPRWRAGISGAAWGRHAVRAARDDWARRLELFAGCAPGLEALTATELGATVLGTEAGGVSFTGTARTMLRAVCTVASRAV